MVQDLEQDRSSAGSDVMLAKLREKLREKEKALEVLLSFPPYKQPLSLHEIIINVLVCVRACEQKALDEKFVAVEEKENEIHLLQLSMREKERDLERLRNLLSHNEETVNVSAV